MSGNRLRDDPGALEVAVAAVAEATGIPASHVEKDYWLTEALRGVAAAAEELSVPICFKGGTSLSKVFGLIRRFSEDVDILAVLRADDSAAARHKVLKALCVGAADATGLEPSPVGDKSSKGEKRAIVLAYPTAQSLVPLRHEGVLVEIGHWGGTYPHERHTIRSMIAEHGPGQGIDGDFEEFEPFDVEVLDPVRTTVEKLMLLHAAATSDAERRLAVARHYYDVWCLLGDDRIRTELSDPRAVATMARDIETFTRVAELPTVGRPARGFATSGAFDPGSETTQVTRAAYDAVVLGGLLWADSPRPSFDDCCVIVQEFPSGL